MEVSQLSLSVVWTEQMDKNIPYNRMSSALDFMPGWNWSIKGMECPQRNHGNKHSTALRIYTLRVTLTVGTETEMQSVARYVFLLLRMSQCRDTRGNNVLIKHKEDLHWNWSLTQLSTISFIYVVIYVRLRVHLQLSQPMHSVPVCGGRARAGREEEQLSGEAPQAGRTFGLLASPLIHLFLWGVLAWPRPTYCCRPAGI